MASATIDGIYTRYEVYGSGPPVLMFSPGGFDATVEKWTTQGIYVQIRPIEHLSKRFTCIAFDRRESGASGGRLEAISWAHYVAQAKGLLDHLHISRAHIMGACMGCSPALAFAVANPAATLSLLLYWPVGGPHYRISSHARFAEHMEFMRRQGFKGVTSLVQAEGKPFNQDPRGGPWATVIKGDAEFARVYQNQEPERYLSFLGTMRNQLFDRDTAPGARPEDLLRVDAPALIVPGRDKTHATSAARYLEECLPRAEYWDVTVADQTATTVPPRLLEFLQRAPEPSSAAG
jgi:pimeloyl-ACP methyl ester carboxylesterase